MVHEYIITLSYIFNQNFGNDRWIWKDQREWLVKHLFRVPGVGRDLIRFSIIEYELKLFIREGFEGGGWCDQIGRGIARIGAL